MMNEKAKWKVNFREILRMIILVKFLELGLQLLRDKPKEQYKMIDSLLNLVFPATIKERHTIGFLGSTGTVYHI